MPNPAPSHKPSGIPTVTPHLWFNGNCIEAIAFYKKAFGATSPQPPHMGPGGNGVMHATLFIEESPIMMADTFPGQWEKGPEGMATAGLWLYVQDVDAVYRRALDSGCESLYEPMDAFWGDRSGKVKDPFGHCWGLATWKYEVTPEELQKGQEEWFASMKK